MLEFFAKILFWICVIILGWYLLPFAAIFVVTVAAVFLSIFIIGGICVGIGCIVEKLTGGKDED